MAAKCGVEQACVFTGTVDREAMVRCYHNSHAFVLTSIAEGMPVSVLEALCTGTPVFSTRCGGAEEVVNSTNGYISELKQPEALASALAKAMRGEVNYNGAQMRQTIVDKYGKEAFKATIAKHYNELISSK
jgi:glycosyltransferase involved in cell wall biosynthesis